jgi:hypothetical protein
MHALVSRKHWYLAQALLLHQQPPVAAGTVHAISKGVVFFKDFKLQMHGGFCVMHSLISR